MCIREREGERDREREVWGLEREEKKTIQGLSLK